MDFIGGALPNIMFIIGIIAIGMALGLEFKIVEIKGELSKAGRMGAFGVGSVLIAISIFLYTRPAPTASAPAAPASAQGAVVQGNVAVAAAPGQDPPQVPATPQTAPTDAGSTVPPTAPAVSPTLPAPPPTAIPTEEAPTVSVPPTRLPTATVSPSTDPLIELRTLLVASVADGRVEKDGGELIKKLEELEEAMRKGERKQAGERLRDLQNKLNEGVKKGTVDSAFVQEALAVLQRVATQYSLSLSPSEK
jgi:hypothetical protein